MNTMSVADARYILSLRDYPERGKFRPGELQAGHLIRRHQIVRRDNRWAPTEEAVALAVKVMGVSSP